MLDDAFWLRYLRAHAQPKTRAIHVAGTTIATMVLVAGVIKRNWRLTGSAFVCGYAPAWFAHAFIEHNRPETLSAPLRSLAADYRMCWAALTGRLDAELTRAGVASVADPDAQTNVTIEVA